MCNRIDCSIKTTRRSRFLANESEFESGVEYGAVNNRNVEQVVSADMLRKMRRKRGKNTLEVQGRNYK